eukprot:2204279-Prymnesium_polylepis.2
MANPLRGHAAIPRLSCAICPRALHTPCTPLCHILRPPLCRFISHFPPCVRRLAVRRTSSTLRASSRCVRPALVPCLRATPYTL